MIIESSYTSVVETRIDYRDHQTFVYLQALTGNSYELLAQITQNSNETWPPFETIRKLIAKKLNHKPLAQRIAIHVCWELGVLKHGFEPGWETPMNRGSGLILSEGPLVQVVPQPTPLSKAQFKQIAHSVSTHFQNSTSHG